MRESLEKLVNALEGWYCSQYIDRASDLVGYEISTCKELQEIYDAYLDAKRELERLKDSDIKITIKGGHEVTIPTK